MKAIAIGGVLIGLLTAATADAQPQPESELEVRVGGYNAETNGAERAEMFLAASSIGVKTNGAFSVKGCGFSQLSAKNEFEAGATAGWSVEITPIRVANHAMTFRLRWVRAVGSGSDFPRTEDVEVTLRAGESRPMDSVSIPPGAETLSGKPCQVNLATLRVFVQPRESRDLAEIDIFLNERPPGGAPRSQRQSLRAIPGHAVPFYFDSITDGNASLDIEGKLTVYPGANGWEVALETISRWTGTQPVGNRPLPNARWFDTTIQMKLDEVVEVTLPTIDRKAGPFSERQYSITIRARRIR